MYVCIYMFICTELIEETGRPPGLIFGMRGYFCLAETSSSLEKNHINADISHLIRDRNAKT